ncbi:hypothetical protein SAMN04489832_1854 [Micromonospora cremea]|uniref:Uncharacterized protein n=1 Tax=Micromonospora cremea TaxID=709881 RepID=A0A1N5VVN8_9ACTN|nr:hypothetical protein SAMN04489832_1854 [Micromonospora cremea]
MRFRHVTAAAGALSPGDPDPDAVPAGVAMVADRAAV